MKTACKIAALVAAFFFTANAHAETIYATTVNRDLITFDSANPSAILSTKPITGLTGQNDFEQIRRMDFRPSTGQLYAVGNAPGGIYRLYTINPATGVATRVNPPHILNPISNAFGFNFDPDRDQIRLVTDDRQNLRYDPATATLISTDSELHYEDGGLQPQIVASSFQGSSEILIDRATSQIVVSQMPHLDLGLLTRGNPLGVTLPNYVSGVNLEHGSAIFLVLSDPGVGESKLYTIEVNGAALVGEIGSDIIINTIAIPPPPKPSLPAISSILKTGPSLPGGQIRFEVATDTGLKVRIQTNSGDPNNEGGWTDLPGGGEMTENHPSNPGAGNYTLVVTSYPTQNGIHFRAISSKSGFTDGKSGSVGPYDLRVPQPPAHGGLSQTVFTVNEKSTASSGVNDTVLRFAAAQTGTPKGLIVRVQENHTDPNNEGGWSDLPNTRQGHMLRDVNGHQFVLNSTDYPSANGVFFRAISSASPYTDSISNVVGPFNLTFGKSHLIPTTFAMVGNSHVADFLFLAHLIAVGNGTSVRVQSSATPAVESSWTNVNPGQMQLSTNPDYPTDFVLIANNLPAAPILYFRAVASQAGSVDSISNASGPYSLVSVTPPAVTINPKPAGLAGSGDGHDADNPIIISTNKFTFGAIAQSNRSIKSLKLQYDGLTIAEFGPDVSSGSTDYIPSSVGDHVLEAVAIDDLGARTRGGTSPVYIRVVAEGSSARPAGFVEPHNPSALQPPKTFRVVTNGGVWTSSSTWKDRNNQPGVPGAADTAIIGSSTVKFTATGGAASVKALSINGGRITGPANLSIAAGGQMSVGEAGATFDNLTIRIENSAAGAFLNASNVHFNGGEILNFGTVNLHGSGGIVGTNQFVNFGKVNWQTPISIPPNPQTNPLAIARPAPVTPQNGAISTSFEVRLIGDGGGTLIGDGGGTLIGDGGGTLISDKGNGIIGDAGAGLIGQDGASLIGQDGASIVAGGGGNFIGVGVGSFKPSGTSNSSFSQRSAAETFTFTQNAGETNLDGIRILGSVVINGGSLTGSGVIAGNVTNKSFIVPGHSAGTIRVMGNFAQTTQGTLVMEIGGAKPDQYDQIQVGGSASLAGKLELRRINNFVPNAADTFSPLSFASATGSLTTRSNTQLTVKGHGLQTTVNPNAPNPSTGQPLNIATRLQIQSGENVLIAGFIITGPAGSSKQVLIRGIGPALAKFGVPGTIPDPLLELHQPGGGVISNDNWQQASNAGQIPQGFAPSNTLESAIYTKLAPGNYSAVLKGAHSETGVGLVEVFDFETTSTAKLANIATRGFVSTGDSVMIGGFIIGGTQPANVLVRALGPSLTGFGIQGALQNTSLELHDQNGTGVIYNDDWRSSQESQIEATTIPPSDDRESAILATLVPGNYTAIVRGANDTTGIAVVEAYNLE